MSEKPSRVEVGQMWGPIGRDDSRTVRRVDGTSVWWTNDLRDRDCDANTACFVMEHAFLGWAPGYGPSPAISTGRQDLPSLAEASRVGSDCSSTSVAARVPWPEVTVGSKWDRYSKTSDEPMQTRTVSGTLTNGDVQFACTSMTASISSFKGGGGRFYEYIPHGWDYATKQPKVTAPVCSCMKPCQPRPKSGPSFAWTCNTCGRDASWTCAAVECGFGICAEHAQAATCTEAKSEPTPTEPARGNTESIDPSIRKAAEAQRAKGPRIVGVYTGNDLALDCENRAHMNMLDHGRGALLIDMEKPARVSAFTERFGRVEESKRYPVSNDVDLDIPEVG